MMSLYVRETAVRQRLRLPDELEVYSGIIHRYNEAYLIISHTAEISKLTDLIDGTSKKISVG